MFPLQIVPLVFVSLFQTYRFQDVLLPFFVAVLALSPELQIVDLFKPLSCFLHSFKNKRSKKGNMLWNMSFEELRFHDACVNLYFCADNEEQTPVNFTGFAIIWHYFLAREGIRERIGDTRRVRTSHISFPREDNSVSFFFPVSSNRQDITLLILSHVPYITCALLSYTYI